MVEWLRRNILKMKIILWVIAFVLFTLAVLQGLLKPVDLAIGGFLIKLGENYYSSIFYWFRFLGHWNISILILIGISILAYKFKARKFAILVLFIFLVMTFIGSGLKQYTSRQRPFKQFYNTSYEEKVSESSRDAYPSGHTLRTTYLWLALTGLISKIGFRRRIQTVIKWISYLVILLVGFSSVVIGAHWLSDIIGAFILAYCFYLILLFYSDYSPLASVKP